jgi:hypothetical protein
MVRGIATTTDTCRQSGDGGGFRAHAATRAIVNSYDDDPHDATGRFDGASRYAGQLRVLPLTGLAFV